MRIQAVFIGIRLEAAVDWAEIQILESWIQTLALLQQIIKGSGILNGNSFIQ